MTMRSAQAPVATMGFDPEVHQHLKTKQEKKKKLKQKEKPVIKGTVARRTLFWDNKG